MTQPGKFDPSFVDPAAKLPSKDEKLVGPPEKKNGDRDKRKFANMLDKKLGNEDEGDSTLEETGMGVASSQSKSKTTSSDPQSGVFELLAMGGKVPSKIDDKTIMGGSGLLVSDTSEMKDMEMTVAALKKEFPSMPGPSVVFHAIKQSHVQPSTDLPHTAYPENVQKLATTEKTDTKDTFTGRDSLFHKKDVPIEQQTPLIADSSSIYTPPPQPHIISHASNVTAVPRQDFHVAAAELVDKLIAGLVVLSQTDRTDTTISLQYPPLFAGSTLVVTEFNTSKQQFNLTFYDLTPEARAMIVSSQNQTTLRNALIERGYTVQMITIEPKTEPKIVVKQDEGQGVKHNLLRQQQQNLDDEMLT